MIKRKPYLLLFFTSLLIFLMGLIKNEETFDINVHDTYFIVKQNHLYWLFSILLFFFFMIYLTFEKIKLPLFKELTRIHIYGTVIFTIGIFFPYDLIFHSSDFPLYNDYQESNIYRSYNTLFFLIAQVLLIINIFASIIKKLRTSVTQ